MLSAMFILIRAATFSALFIGFFLVYLPGRFLERAGMVRPEGFGPLPIGGMIVCAIGAAIALWCIATFAFVGKGTPAPFDPPRPLVIQGPYRFVRNPMYIGAGLALIGAAMLYQSWALIIYTVLFLLATHLFVVGYEEPNLRVKFGADYEDYCKRVQRWLPDV